MNQTSSVDAILQVNAPNIPLDTYTQKALEELAAMLRSEASQGKEQIKSQGLTSRVSQVTAQLNATSLKGVTQLLLSNKTIYSAMLCRALKEGANDEQALQNAVLRYLEDVKKVLYARMIDLVRADNHIDIKQDTNKWQMLGELVLAQGIPIESGKVKPAVLGMFNTIHERGLLDYYLDEYIKRGEIEPSKFTPAIKTKMLDHLVKLNLKINDNLSVAQQTAYDEYFALAYSEAIGSGSATNDPIDQVYTTGFKNSWDFTVDDLTKYDKQNVEPENILAAGALDYIYCVGEAMRVFDATDALVLRWASGLLDIPDGSTASALYRYYKRRDDRSSAEERAMLYKRVLNRGNGQLLTRMVANTGFTDLWNELMQAVMAYIRKSEHKVYWNSWQDNGLSLTHIYRVTEDLQYNLTLHMTGMAHLQVTEDYHHLKEALDIISSHDIRNYYGGSNRQSVWNTIARIVQEEFHAGLNTEVIKTMATEGNKVFQWLANFNENTVTAAQFQTFAKAAEAWAIAQSSLSGGRVAYHPHYELPGASLPVPAGYHSNGYGHRHGHGYLGHNALPGADFNGSHGLSQAEAVYADASDEFDQW